MREQVLFAWLPYAVLVTFGLGVVLRLRRTPSKPSPGPSPERRRSSPSWRSWSWRIGLAGVVAGHVIGFLAPGLLEALHRSPRLFLALEALGALLGLAALSGLLLQVLAPGGRPAPRGILDTVALTLLVTSLATGLAIALAYRGAPSWYGTVLVPYLRSLLVLEPRTGLLTPLPYPLRLHVLAAFLLFAAAPWTSPAVAAARRLKAADPGTGRPDEPVAAVRETP